MKKIKPKLLIKILIVVLGGGLFIFSAQDIYRYWVRAERVNEEFVQFYRPQLDTVLIKQAAEVLR